MPGRAFFTRSASIASEIERCLRGATVSVDAALYRMNHPALAKALAGAMKRGVHVRIVLDRGKFQESDATRKLLLETGLPYRLSCGRKKRESKMHHKFAIVDHGILLTGSYNWTLESEEGNYENLVVLSEPALVEAYAREFETLWNESSRADSI